MVTIWNGQQKPKMNFSIFQYTLWRGSIVLNQFYINCHVKMILIRSLWIANKPTADFFIHIVFCLAPPMLCVYSGGRVNNFRSQREEEF